MKIQKGMVKYKDRNDIICMYGVTDDGKTYYFLDGSDGKAFSNGNRVVSTELVEAIDPMVKASNVGVIDSNGNEVIKCENKAVKLVNDNVVLVEKANPVTESVISAIGFRNDPLHAANLVSTPAKIKDNIYREMGNDGRFLFNDQFAEATVCDINGNNLVNDEIYSFVAMNNNHLYLSKNTPDSSVVHFALDENKVEENVSTDSVQKVKEEVPTSEVEKVASTDNLEQSENESKIDVSEVNVPIDVVEGALDGETTAQDSNVIQDNFEIDSKTPIENVNEGLVAPSAEEILAASSVGTVNTEEHAEEVPSENTDNQVSSQSEVPSEDVGDNVKEETEVHENTSNEENVVESNEFVMEENGNTEVSSSDAAEETTENNETEEVVPEIDESILEESEKIEVTDEDEVVDVAINTTESESDGAESIEVPSEEVVENTAENKENTETVSEIDEFVSEEKESTEVSNSDEADAPLNEDDIQSLLDETSTDLFNGTSLKVDSIVNDGIINDDLDSYALDLRKMERSENFLGDVAKSMTGLIKQNREQRSTIANYEEVINGLNSSKDELKNKVSSLEHENIGLSDRNRSLENAVVKLKSRVEMLAGKLQEQKEKINEQAHELQVIRPQLEGRDQLIELLKDAQSLIGEDKDSKEEYGYSKVA